MRKAFRHTGVLMMVAVVALGLVGSAFALWFQVLTFTGTVATGSLSVQASTHGATEIVCIKTDTNECEDYADFGIPATGKATTTCALTLGETNVANDTWVLTITNAFPFSGCEITPDVTNTGTIPVHIDLDEAADSFGGDAIGLVDGAQAPVACTFANGSQVPASRFFVGTNGHNQLQVHPNESVSCTFRIWLLQAAAESTTYHLTGQVIARQYNEDGAAVSPGAFHN